MNKPKCACESFARLEGASATAYTKTYLDEAKDDEGDDVKRYRCRECGRLWERRQPEEKSESTRASLVRLD